MCSAIIRKRTCTNNKNTESQDQDNNRFPIYWGASPVMPARARERFSPVLLSEPKIDSVERDTNISFDHNGGGAHHKESTIHIEHFELI